MSKIFHSVCPLNCLDSCGLLVEVDGGRVAKVSGDPRHPLTRGFICGKGQKLIERTYSPDRIRFPLRRTGSGWQRISWAEALSAIGERLLKIREEYGSSAVLHHRGHGSNGVLKNLDRRFFNAFGGVTEPEGSVCWGSGYAAQEYDFGGVYCHSWEDCLNSRTIILWGRDPAVTNLHLVPLLKEAQAKGARLISVNPVQTKSAELADAHVGLRPGTDGALALGMAHVILRDRLLDLDFVANHVHGFEEYAKLVKEYTPEKVAHITGVPRDTVESLAQTYAKRKPSAIFLGYGLQRYTNGGKTVRAIDALAAITGNIGIAGGGVNYAHRYNGRLLSSITGDEMAIHRRYLPYPVLAQAILEAQEPPIKAIFVTRSNPVSQLSNTALVKEAFTRAGLVVVIDYFLTDTAELADYILPCTTGFEAEDLVTSSWQEFWAYAPKLVEPVGEARPEAEIFGELAQRMGLKGFGERTAGQWLEEALAPAAAYGINLQSLKNGAVRNPLAPAAAWQDKQFATPSGKYELYSNQAAADGLDPLPSYAEPRESLTANPWVAREYPLHFLTPHPRDCLNSQLQNLKEESTESSLPVLEIHPRTAEARYIRNNDLVLVESPRGEMRAIARLTGKVPIYLVQVAEGGWLKAGGGVNFLTPDVIPDLGMGIPYYDCVCQVRKYHID